MDNDSFVNHCNATFALCIFYDIDVDNLCHLGANLWPSMYEQTLEKYTGPINISSLYTPS